MFPDTHHAYDTFTVCALKTKKVVPFSAIIEMNNLEIQWTLRISAALCEYSKNGTNLERQ